MKILVLISSLFFIFSSCTKEVKIDIPGYQEKIVIDGSIQTGQPPIVLISTSKDIYSATDLSAYLSGFISGAIVTVNNGITSVQLDEICTDNLPPGTEQIAANLFGIPVEDLVKYHLCAYTSFNPAIWGEIGKTYSLSVKYNGQEFTSTTTINQPTTLDSVYWKPDDKYLDYGFSWAKLSDNPSSYDAYLWEVKQINIGQDGKPMNSTFTKTFMPVFDDEFINGITFDFYFENPISFNDTSLPTEYKGFYHKGDSIVIKFSKMDKVVYNYMEKKYAQLQTQGNPFATPINIPSNISGGALGLWAGYSPSYDTLFCN
ncbi:MAG: DUF4249 domain-containing protein [Flavobacteriia bacterium]|nr:DUF4249 domain-containing protein [Flavobacteriia bacterium]